MDDLFDSGLGTVLRFIKGVIKDFLYDIVCYAVGWLILRCVTAGQYPGESLREGIQDPDSIDSLTSIIGLVALVAIGYYFFA